MSLIAKTDRTFTLEVIDDTKAKDSLGAVDPRLFKGGNILHITKSDEYNFWTFSYQHGIIPELLRCKFTSFTQAFRHAETYYGARNLKIVEIDP